MSKPNMSRRVFISTTAMIGLSMAIDWKSLNAFAAQIKDKNDYPVIVIGAGLGGLCCGALLAKRGFPVTVVEQHSIPGGYATTFRRAGGKFTFDVSLHRMSADREMRRLMKELGVLNKIEFVKIPDTTRVITPSRNIRMADNLKQKVCRLIEKFPDKKKNINTCLAEMQTMVDELKLLKAKGGGKHMASQYPRLWKIKDQTVAAFMDEYIKEPEIKESLTAGSIGTFGLPPSKLSAFMFIMARATGENEQYYIKRRSQNLSNALAESIEESGGRILYKKMIKKIMLSNNAVSGVLTSDGKHLPAKIVISNANAKSTFDNMLPFETIPPDYINRINEYGPSLSTFVIWLGLNREINKTIKDSHIVISSDRGIEADYLSCMKGEIEKANVSVTIYDNYYNGYSKPGTSTITIITGSGMQPWQKFESDYKAGRKVDYLKEKERWTRILMEKVEENAIPGLSSMVEVKVAATPLTNQRYTLNPGGAIYGFPCSVENCFMNRIKNQTPVKGLYLASAWGGSGPGYAPGLKGGEHTFKQVLKDLV